MILEDSEILIFQCKTTNVHNHTYITCGKENKYELYMMYIYTEYEHLIHDLELDLDILVNTTAKKPSLSKRCEDH